LTATRRRTCRLLFSFSSPPSGGEEAQRVNWFNRRWSIVSISL
jgi:hypothetical protein